MKNDSLKWMGFKSLMKELVLDEIEIFQLIKQNKLSAYRLISTTEYIEDLRIIPQPIQEWSVEADHKPDQLVFDREDVERLKAADEKGTARNPVSPKIQNETADKILKLYFPALLLEPLKLIARRWAETFYGNVPIRKMVLYPYGSKFAGFLAEKQRGNISSENHPMHRYAIVFEIDAEDETSQMDMGELNNYTMKKVRGQVSEKPWDKLLRDIHYHETASVKRYPQLLQSDFCSVYKDPPVDVPFWEWDIEVQFKNTTLQDSVRDEHFEPRVVLYAKSEIGQLEEKIALYNEGFLPDSKLIDASQLETWQWAVDPKNRTMC